MDEFQQLCVFFMKLIKSIKSLLTSLGSMNNIDSFVFSIHFFVSKSGINELDHGKKNICNLRTQLSP
jgi:hypothetical protein